MSYGYKTTYKCDGPGCKVTDEKVTEDRYAGDSKVPNGWVNIYEMYTQRANGGSYATHSGKHFHSPECAQKFIAAAVKAKSTTRKKKTTVPRKTTRKR